MQLNKLINPFINNLRVPYIEIIKKIPDTYGGEPEAYKVEAESYFRVYSSKHIRVFLYKELNMWARDMFTAIQYFTNSDYKYVIISYEKIVELYGEDYGKRRYDDTIRELIRFSIIDIKDRAENEYWYNPAYFSPTTRITLFEECLYKVKTVYKQY